MDDYSKIKRKFSFCFLMFLYCMINNNANNTLVVVLCQYAKQLIPINVPAESDIFRFLKRHNRNIQIYGKEPFGFKNVFISLSYMFFNDNTDLITDIKNFSLKYGWQDNFGPSIWYVLHIMSQHFDKMCTINEKKLFLDVVKTSISCKNCYDHYESNLKYLKEKLDTESMETVILEFHNIFNEPHEDYRAIYHREYTALIQRQ